MKKLTGRGGPGRNQGLRPGTYKNALKKPSERRSIKKQVSYTEKEFKRLHEALVKREYKTFNAFAREATLRLTEEILVEPTNG